MKNLENYGVQELDAKEVINVDGGLEPMSYMEWYDDASALGNAGSGLGVAAYNAYVIAHNNIANMYNLALYLFS